MEEFLCFSLPRFSLACPLLGFCTFPFCVDSEFPSPSKDNISNAMPFSFPLFVTLTPVLRCSPSGLLLLSCRSYVSDPLFPPLPPPPCPFPGADILRLSRCSHFPVPRPPSSGETLRFFFSCLRFFFRSLKMSKMRRRSTVPNEGNLSSLSGRRQITFPFLLVRGGSTALFNRKVSTITVSSRRISTSHDGKFPARTLVFTGRGSDTA